MRDVAEGAMNEDLRLHREAEALMGLADQAKAQRRLADSARFNREAAHIEARVFDLLPLNRPKTCGITAISSVALFRKAGALDEAIQQAEHFLRCDDLPELARFNLSEMVEEMRAEIEAGAAVERTTSS
jgi:hypothetical protein